MRHFCTLFDHNYLYKGLALYNSINSHCDNFTMWILAMSDESFDILSKLSLKNVRLIRLIDLEDEELKLIKKKRTTAEYCWTLTPSLPLYILSNYKEVGTITYIDADCLFFSSPEILFQELENKSIMIVEHRFSPDRALTQKTVGRFNVEWLTFNRDSEGLKALRWWRERCNEWCYHRFEDGKMADQMYLNDWPERFEKVQVLENIGGGVAPWNVSQYEITTHNNKVMVDKVPLVFYHFHAFKIISKNSFELATNYNFKSSVKKAIYEPYQKAILVAIDQVSKVDSTFSYGYQQGSPFWKSLLDNYILYYISVSLIKLKIIFRKKCKVI